MAAALPTLAPHPVQLTLDLRTGITRCRRRDERPYWDYVDLADLGGERLCARRPGVHVMISAEQRRDGTWLGYHDLLIESTGSSGATRPQLARQDALASAAYAVAQHCRAIMARPTSTRPSVAAARQLTRWMGALDLL